MMIVFNNAATSAAASSSVAAALDQHNPSAVANLQVVSVPPPPSSSLTAPPNPRKKRTKLIRIENPLAAAAAVKRKPDPDAPKITRPCSECGKKFWSWKALFGHMRCHPERQWRGINPPPNFRNRVPEDDDDEEVRIQFTEDDHEVAGCLLMLANSPISRSTPAAATNLFCPVPIQTISIAEDDSGEGIISLTDGDHNCRFECSCCRKVFTSHQALGGHRASHRNVKGCFAITNPDGDFNDGGGADLMELTRDNCHHKCGICSRVFSSGQALGGHKRCHWEKTINNELPSSSSSSIAPLHPPLPLLSSIYHRHQPAGDGGVDLNSPVVATLESLSPSVCQDCHHGFISGGHNSYYTTCSLSSNPSPALDLRLGL